MLELLADVKLISSNVLFYLAAALQTFQVVIDVSYELATCCTFHVSSVRGNVNMKLIIWLLTFIEQTVSQSDGR